MAASDIRAGGAYVELYTKDSRLNKGLLAAQKRLKSWGKSVAVLGGVVSAAGTSILSPLLASVKAAETMGSALNDMSGRTGVSIEALSELGYAAKLTGVEMDSLEIAIKKMEKLIGEAEQGSTAAADSLRHLGLTIFDLKGLSPDQAFTKIADKIAAVDDPAKRATLAMQAFGKAGTALLPMMADGAGGIEAMRKRAQELGLVMSTSDAQAADKFGDTLDTLIATVKMGAVNIGSALIPMLTDFAAKAVEVSVKVGAWIKENRGLIVSAAKIAAVMVAAGAAIVGVGLSLGLIGSAAGGLSAIMMAVAGAVGLAVSAFGAIASAVAFLISPIGIVTAAVVGLAGYFIYSSGAIGQAIDWLSGGFDILKNDALSAFGGIKDALAGGDFKLAAEILWTSLKLVFKRGIGVLEGYWIDFKSTFQHIWADAVFGAAAIFTSSWAGLQTGWNETIGFLSDAWTVFTSFVAKSWNTSIGFIQKAWVKLKSLFDKDINVEAEVKRIDDETNAKNQGVTDSQNATIGQSDQGRRDRNTEIAQAKTDALANIDDDKKRRQTEISATQSSDMAALEQELAKLEADRDALLTKAKSSSAAREKLGPLDTKIAELKNTIQGPDAETGKKVEGTFNANAAAGMFAGGGGAAERTAKATEESARQQKRTNKILEGTRQGLAVGVG